MERMLEDQVRLVFGEGLARDVYEQSLGAARLTVLRRAARILRVPVYAAEGFSVRVVPASEGIVLSDPSLRCLDEAWHRIVGTFSDNRVSNQERLVREKLFRRAPHCVDVGVLSKFVGVLVKRDTLRGSEAPGEGAAGATGADRDETEFSRSGAVSLLASNVLNALLAVDGFRGVLPANYRNYVRHLDDGLPPTEKDHLAAVRAMYEESGCFEEGRHSGTFAAACVFLALLGAFSERAAARLEDGVRSKVDRAAENASRFLERHDEEEDSRDRSRRSERLADAYRKRLGGGERTFEWIAFEKLKEYGRCANVKFLF